MMNPSLEGESPQSPPCGETASEESGLRGEQAESDRPQRLLKAKSDYPEVTNRAGQLDTLVNAMTADEFDLFCRACSGARVIFDESRKAKRHKSFLDLARFAADKATQAGYAERAPPPPAPPRPTWLVPFGTDAWRGLCVRMAICGYKPPIPIDYGAAGKGLRLEFQVGPDTLALAPHASMDGAVDMRAWLILRRDHGPPDERHQCAAWLGRIEDWTNGRAVTTRFWSNKDRVPVEKRDEAELVGGYVSKSGDLSVPAIPMSVEGLRVPQPWPPAKGERKAATPVSY